MFEAISKPLLFTPAGMFGDVCHTFSRPFNPGMALPRKRKSKVQTNIRLTELSRQALVTLANMRGCSQADEIEQLIRDEAKRCGLWDGKSARLTPP